MSVHTPASRAQRHLIRLTTLSLLVSQSWSVWATPTQSPLINRPEGTPIPNLMLTLDDSGSMTHQYLPEGKFMMNDQELYFPPDARIYVHPREIPKNIWTFSRSSTTDVSMGTAPDLTSFKAFYDTRIVTAVPKALESTELNDADAKLYQYQMRSPQVNTIYYNPALKYEPWESFDTENHRTAFKTPAFTSVALDPLALDPAGDTYPAGWIDTTSKVNLSEIKTYAVHWSQRVEPWNTTVAPQATPKAKTYNPALLYLLIGTNPKDTSSYQYYDLNDGGGSITYPFAYDKRTDCTRSGSNTVCDREVEKQNFANWFAFYRSRLFIAQGGLPGTLNNLNVKFRGGWGTLHQGIQYTNGIPDDLLGTTSYKVDGKDSKTVQHGMREWVGQPKYDFAKWIRTLKTYGGTPIRQAAQSVQDYFMRTDPFSPWSSDMEAGSDLSKHLSCRRAYNLVLTDGYYTPLASGEARPGNVDALGSKKLDGMLHPFSDSNIDTLADFVMNSYLNDLQPKITQRHPNPKEQVKPLIVTPKSSSADDILLANIQSDMATHLHLNYFFIGFGISGKLFNRSVLSTPEAYNSRVLELAHCGEGGQCWTNFNPENASPEDRGDDMHHAALNGRGTYFDVKNAQELSDALREALMNVEASTFKEAGLATASPALIADNVKFVPEYFPYSWKGTLRAIKLDENGKLGVELWNAENKVPPANATSPGGSKRNIFVRSGKEVVELASGLDLGAGSAQQNNDLIDFLRGGNGAKTMRVRKSVLPDFVNSTPLFVKSSTASDGLLLIGGNGGMLHAFNTTSGKEEFAYIPAELIPKLPKLAQPNYGTPDNFHEYFVDGQLADAALDAQHRVVVAALGAGGRAMIGLQLNWPEVTKNLDAKTVKWEATHDDMGYITTTPQFGRMPDGSLKVFVGNGVDSKSGKIALLVLDAQSGTVQSVQVDTPPDSGPQANTSAGLGGVTLVTDPNSGVVTTVYAGDTLGRVWRFDIDGHNGNISVGYGRTPLFTATAPGISGTAQPIVGAPAVFTHTQGGQIVVVSTGRLLYHTDEDSTQTQSVYGLWDKIPTSQSSADQKAPSISRTNLQQQAIVSRHEVAGRAFFELTGNNVSWSKTAGDTGKMGWYLDLALPNTTDASTTSYSYPKAFYDPLPFGRSVLITAIVPGSKEESCTESLAKGFGFLIKAQTGARQKISSVDVDGNGVINDDDPSYSGFEEQGTRQKVLPKEPVTCTGDQCGSTPPPPTPCSDGRAENAFGGTVIRDCGGGRINDRIWRQLMNPPRP